MMPYVAIFELLHMQTYQDDRSWTHSTHVLQGITDNIYGAAGLVVLMGIAISFITYMHFARFLWKSVYLLFNVFVLLSSYVLS